VTLIELRQRFVDARVEVIEKAAVHAPDRCRYCGQFWQKWLNSKLDGHSKCIVPAWFKALVAETMRADVRLTYGQVAAALGVSIAVLRSWAMPISSRGAA
jgi:hypothetical protein